MSSVTRQKNVAVIGGGPAGLMAAEVLAEAGLAVEVFDAMPSVGRKFLLAGVGGMNITHAEPFDAFVGRYAARAPEVGGWLSSFGPDELRQWIHALGIETFVGSSGRVFPTDMKAAPLLRAWLHRLKGKGVRFHQRHRFTGWNAQGELCFLCPEGAVAIRPDAVVLSLGGGSWSRLGSDGAWVSLLQSRGVAVAPLRPANSGFEVAGWTDVFRERSAGAPLKSVVATVAPLGGDPVSREGECIVTATGLEGSLVYALSSFIRDRIEATGHADLVLDLAPGKCRLKQGGGHAGHNGLRSIHQHIGEAYGRVRLGIGHPGHKDAVAGYVLHDFAKADQTWLDDLLRGLSDGAAMLAADESAKFLNAVALRVAPPRSSTGTGAPKEATVKEANACGLDELAKTERLLLVTSRMVET